MIGNVTHNAASAPRQSRGFTTECTETTEKMRTVASSAGIVDIAPRSSDTGFSLCPPSVLSVHSGVKLFSDAREHNGN
jgi:hypothetical protein